jgi:hypothetical protein
MTSGYSRGAGLTWRKRRKGSRLMARDAAKMERWRRDYRMKWIIDPELIRMRQSVERRPGFQEELDNLEEEIKQMTDSVKVTIEAESEKRGEWSVFIGSTEWSRMCLEVHGTDMFKSRIEAERAAKEMCKLLGLDYKR